MKYLIGEPNNAKNDEYCGEINTEWPERNWNDNKCTIRAAYYICKKIGG